ncbi:MULTISPECIES: DHH family phosphoesterase [unclassified Clostridium]|jgi:c-di-AMP phosphodiesterase-like protein|uniref:DHH family phosphoesterase n=1 Tax=Clostridium TaxID=1485 RepID=UPI001C8C4B5B|nr:MULTISPECIES: DHH family phosphoesterase [unclassified Clostridium]MBX9138706.1 DHH family phosphoesterase [Clostridium sp. K12(2020)]MBX9145528.1 DHH family phosphoesterase [Clostridium sp. K13]MDU2290688.1 DHH family phosphoesterase [Clostridium celatum]MDU4325005.1 DHH family phosphoesterase [Clostridium celatum]
MKKKLKKYRKLLISFAIIILVIILYYIKAFYLAGTVLLMYVVFNEYLDINRGLYNEKVDTLTTRIKANINDNISNMSYPLALIDNEGNILWANKRLKEELNLLDLQEQNILSIGRNLDLQKLLKCDKDLRQRVKIKDSFYSIYATNISNENESYVKQKYIVYFNEVSNLRDLYSTRESIMLIEVDNLSEALEVTDEANRPMLAAEVEKAINSYSKKLKSMIIKYEYNKYCLSVQDKYINDEINCKFSILDEISNIDRGNKLEVTLSIGIGRGGDNSQENYNNAMTARELALGRGGDQVVIKNNEKISFFGGNTRELEKRTRVRARVIAQALRELIFESSNILIMGHKNPDMDAFGASVGLWSAIRQLGKSCNIIIDNDINAIDYYMNKLKSDSKYDNLLISSSEAEKAINDKTLLIIVDVHNKGYVSNLNIAEKINRKIIIDHHRRSPDIIEGALLNYIEVYASSTSEMVTELIQYMLQKPRISKIEAEGLLGGIFMDTKGFQFKSGVRTFDAAAFLRSLGADTIEVKKMFTDSLEDYLLISETIKSAKVYDNLAIAVCPSAVNNTVIVARAADELLGISGIDVCFVLCEINNSIIISGRSTGEGNVQVILEELGGGGHMNMAGAKLDEPMNEALYMLKEAIKKHLKLKE